MPRPSAIVYQTKALFKPPGLLLVIAGIGTLVALFFTNAVQPCINGYCADFSAYPIAPLLVAVFPGLFFLWLYRQDRFESEPWSLLLLLFGFGAISTIIALLLNSSLGEPLYLVGFVEEPCKILGVALVVFNKKYGKEFNGPMDGLVWGAAAGAGFATVESTEYFLKFQLLSLFAPVNPGEEALVRNVAGIGHLVYTGIACWWLGMAKARRGKITLLDLIPGLTIAIFMHGVYDEASTANPLILPFGILAVFVAFFVKAVREAHMEEVTWGFKPAIGSPKTYGFARFNHLEDQRSFLRIQNHLLGPLASQVRNLKGSG